MGILAALLRRRPVRHAQHRAASAGTGACRRLVPRAHSAGWRAAVGARGRSDPRHPPARHAPRPPALGLDPSHPRRHHCDRARAASPVAGGPRGGAAISATRAGSRRHRREAGGQFRDGRPWHGAGAAGAGPRRLAHRGHAQGRGDDGRRDAEAWWRTACRRPPVLAALGLALALRGRAGGRTRPPCRGGTGRHAGGRSRPARRRRAGAQPCAGLATHEAAWNARWIASDIHIEGDDESQRALRFAVYHLTSAANPEDDRVSIGARALTGDAYLGHVFWDTEIYLLPFYTAVWPEAARALLMYRFHTLSGARAKAAHFGFKGALYAWESA